MPAKRNIAEARRYVQKKLGKAFEGKCGDALALILHERARRPAEAVVQVPMLLTFEPIDLTKEVLPAFADIGSRLRTLRGRFPALTEAATERESLHALTVADQVGAVVRSRLIARMQEAARQRYQPIVARLRGHVPTEGAGSGGSAGKKAIKSLMECWLTGSVRVETPPALMADVAAHQALVSIDRPRRVLPEIYETAGRVGAPQFRQSANVDGTGVVVAVIDGEVDATHAGLQGRVVQKANFSSEPWGGPDGHGTAVAGIIGSGGEGSDAARRIIGMAPSATVYSYRLWPMGDEFLGSVAIQQAYADGAQVINCSWFVPDPTPRDGTCETCRAVDNVWTLGVPVVKSAGNRGPGPGTTTCPANARHVVSVGATDRGGNNISNFSSRGPTADGRLKPEVVAPGEGIWSCQTNGRYGLAPGRGRGTSFAAPHVAGLVALLLQAEPALTPDDILARLRQRATPIPGLGENDQGAGFVRLG